MALSIDLSGRTALVTGVTDGIGVGIARKLAEAGCDVAGCGRRARETPEAARFISIVEGYGRRAVYSPTDVSLVDGPEQFVASAIAAFGRVDLVVSNAGRNVFDGVLGCSEERWAECMNLDLAAHWRLAKASHPHLVSGTKPVMIINGSNHAYSTLPGCFPYNVAKAGLLGLVQSLALEWGPTIRAVGIAPGFIATPGNEVWLSGFDDPEAKRHEVEQGHPVGRIGTPDEIGGICAFLASEYAAFISGSTILIDGGHAANMGW